MSALQLLQMIMWIILVIFCYCVYKIAPEMFSQEPSQTVIPEHTADTKSRSQTLSHWREAHVQVCSAKVGCSDYRSKCDQHLWYDATCSFLPTIGFDFKLTVYGKAAKSFADLGRSLSTPPAFGGLCYDEEIKR